MPETVFDKKIKKIETETAELKRQIMQLEFQNKKDAVTARKRIEAAEKRTDDWENRWRKQIDHIIKLVGITYEELDNLDLKLQETGRHLVRPRKSSTLA